MPTATVCSSRLELAAAPGRHHAVPDHDEPHHRHAHLADQDDDGHPPRHDPDDRQSDQGHPEHRLVGDRVGHLAEVRHLLAAPREVTVDAVGHHRDAEHGEGREPAAPDVPAFGAAAASRTPARGANRKTVRSLGRFQALGARGPADRWSGGPGRRAHRAAGEEVDALAGDDGGGARGRPTDGTGSASASTSVVRAVDVRALVRGAVRRRPRRRRSGPRTPTSTSTASPMRSSARWAVAPRPARSPARRARRRPRRAACRRRPSRLGAVLVGVPEHADDVEPGGLEEGARARRGRPRSHRGSRR